MSTPAGVGRAVPRDVLERVRLGVEGHPTPARVAAALRRQGLSFASEDHLWRTAESVVADLVGYGPLDPLVRDPSVCDVLVNGPFEVWVDRGVGLERAPVAFRDEADLRRLVQRLVSGAGRRIDDAQPWADAQLEGGVRLHAVLPPLAGPGTCLSLRVRRPRRLTFPRLVECGCVPPDAAALLREAVVRRLAVVVTGGTGSGKTTLLEALVGLVPPGERVVTIEESAELAPDHPHVVGLVARVANVEGAGAVTLRDLVRQSLRMRPDRIVLGEARGPEVVDLLSAFNTGHAGGAATLHAGAPTEVPARFELLGALAGLPSDAVGRLVGASIQVVVHMVREQEGPRSLAEIGVIARDVSGVRVVPAWRRDTGVVADGGAGLEAMLSRDRGLPAC